MASRPRQNRRWRAGRLIARGIVCLGGALIAGAVCVGAAVGQEESLRFTDIAAEAGVTFRHDFGAGRLDNILMTTGGGSALVDFDGDGWLDALLVNGTAVDGLGAVLAGGSSHALFRSDHGEHFTDVTAAAGLGTPSYGMGATAGDFDGDGMLDLYITNYGDNRLYRNLGDGTFEDVTAAMGLEGGRWSTGAVFFDYDNDADLDLYVAHYLDFRPDMPGVHASSLSKRGGMRSFPSPRDYDAESDRLYRNDGDRFSEVGSEVGLVEAGKGFMPVAADFDQDGDIDLFVANDASPNFLYRNDGGTLSEVALASGAAFDPQGVETGAMGVDLVDVDGDGLQDLYVTNFIFEHNNLYRNLGGLLFEEATRAARLDRDNHRYVGWATRFADFDHDGYLDCFVANGHVTDYVDGFSQGVTYRQENMLFRGAADGRFNRAKKLGDDFGERRVSRGAAFGDIDHDGDIDILISNSGDRAQLLRNDLPRNDQWLQLRLVGRGANRQALGAKVTVRVGQRQVFMEARFPGTYLSSSDPTLHVGLRAGEENATVEVTWPSGQRSTHSAAAGTLVLIREP